MFCICIKNEEPWHELRAVYHRDTEILGFARKGTEEASE